MAKLDDPTAQSPGTDQGDEQPEEQPEQFFSPQVRYAGADVVCGNCEYYSGGQCTNDDVIQDIGGQVDAGGRCEQFDPKGDGADELQQSLQSAKPFGPGQMPAGMSNS